MAAHGPGSTDEMTPEDENTEETQGETPFPENAEPAKITQLELTEEENQLVTPSTSRLRQGNIDEIQVSPGTDVLMECLLQKKVRHVAICGHPRCIGEASMCTDLRCAQRCPLVEHPVFVTARVPDMLGSEEYGNSGIPAAKLMHCGNCSCNLQVTKVQMQMSENITCPSCGHVNKARFDKQS